MIPLFPVITAGEMVVWYLAGDEEHDEFQISLVPKNEAAP